MRSAAPTNDRQKLRVARDLAHSATALAAEAANLARAFERGDSEAGQAASRASIKAAEVAFGLDERARHEDTPPAWLALARQSLEAASSALAAATVAVESAAPPMSISADEPGPN